MNPEPKLDIIHHATHLVVNKPGGLLSVPSRGPDKQDCVANRLKNLLPSCIAQPAVQGLDGQPRG